MVRTKKKLRKKRSDATESIRPAIEVGVSSIGINLVGQGVGGLLPAGTINPLTKIGGAAAKAAGPIGIIGLTALTIKELNKIKRKGGKK